MKQQQLACQQRLLEEKQRRIEAQQQQIEELTRVKGLLKAIGLSNSLKNLSNNSAFTSAR